MATARNGQTPGRGAGPARQSPAPARQGRAAGDDPTFEGDQAPQDIFGFTTRLDSTGAPGSMGAGTRRSSADVTLEPGQLDEGFTGLSADDIADTGVPGGNGTVNRAGGDTVSYTPPGYNDGGPYRTATEQGNISGPGEWTQANSDGYSGGPTLPGLENNRPTSTGAGRGNNMRGGRHT